jgi:hypothetical protein
MIAVIRCNVLDVCGGGGVDGGGKGVSERRVSKCLRGVR